MRGFTLGPITTLAVGILPLLSACSPPGPEPTMISLVEQFADARVENQIDPGEPPPRHEWRFDGEGTIEIADHESTGGWRALNAIEGLAVEDGILSGRTGENPLLVAPAPSTLEADDLLHAVEIRMRASEGELLSVQLVAGEEFDDAATIGLASSSLLLSLNRNLVIGDDLQTYTLTADDSSIAPSFSQARLQHLVIRPSDVEGAEFAIESVRLVSRREHLATVESGVGWQGLGEIYRETVVARAPERIVFPVVLPSQPRLELHVGTIEGGAVTFVVEVGDETVLRRTVSRPGVWHPLRVDLAEQTGGATEIALSLESDENGRVGYWGGASVRNAAGSATLAEASPSRRALTEREAPPRGVILILADTLRRDHLEPWGHERSNAPTFVRLASEGALFRDAIAQGPWTKVSASAILTSLYPATHGLLDMPDRLPASVTTVAEAFRAAGYATFATSSVPFTGKLTNLHQGVEVLHERPSIEDLDQTSAKTARTFVDRLLPWLDEHQDVPFFVFLHIFDPHSPFEPAEPYSSMWMDADTRAEFREDMKQVAEHVEDPFMKLQSLPTTEEMEASGVDRETYLECEKIWYDASILAMDVEIARLFERLEQLGLAEDTLVAFVSDHGEEFLEHGRSFHGANIYGEHTNVPMMLWWPKVVPPTAVDETVETIDLVPTLLELARVDVPEEMQGKSLLPLLLDPGQRDELGWRSRPAFSERRSAPGAFNEEEGDRFEQISIVFDGWRLVKNFEFREGHREIELYDHVEDPLNLIDVADEHPEVVTELLPVLERWYARATAAKVEADSESEMSAAELERLRSLGYVR